MDIDQDEHEHEHSSDESEQGGPATASTRAGKRVAELQQVEENIAALLHFAGCTLASLHPDPLSSFTVREIATDDADDDDDEGHQGPDSETKKKPATTPNAAYDQDPEAAAAAKLQEFAKYADGYFATLNDVQLALRTSIRHLRVSRISARVLTDPNYGSLLVSRSQPRPSDQNYAAAVGPGGVAFDGGSGPAAARGGGGGARSSSATGKQEEEEDSAGWDMRASRLPSSSGPGPGPGPGPGSRSSPTPTTRMRMRMSVAALEVERDALQELVAALEGGGE